MSSLSELEQKAWEMWQHDHPDDKDAKSWHELPAWVQSAYINYLSAS